MKNFIKVVSPFFLFLFLTSRIYAGFFGGGGNGIIVELDPVFKSSAPVTYPFRSEVAISTSVLRTDLTATKVSTGTLVTLATPQTITGIKTFTSSVTITAPEFSVGASTFVVKGGNIGIGTTTPEAKLNIIGGEFWLFNENANPKVIIGDSSISGQYGFLQWDSINDYCRVETIGTNGLKIKDNYIAIGNIFPSQPLIVGLGSSELFRVQSDGKIGIKNQNPTHKLDVNGNAIVRSSLTVVGETFVSTITVRDGANILFDEAKRSSIGQFKANRPYKIYVASEVIVGGGSIIISEDSIFSTKLKDNIVTVSTTQVIFTSVVKMPKRLEVEEVKVMTAGLNSRGDITTRKDFRLERAYYGLVLTSTSGYKYMLWVDDGGRLFTTRITSSPEIPQEERVKLINQKMAETREMMRKHKAINKKSVKVEDLLQRIEVLETLLNVK